MIISDPMLVDSEEKLYTDNEIRGSINELMPLITLTHPRVLIFYEDQFFDGLESLSDSLRQTNDKYVIISHCLDQVSGFQYYNKLPTISDLSIEFKDRVLFIILSVHDLKLTGLDPTVRYFYFPEYHAVYWSLYKDYNSDYKVVNKKFLSLNKRGDIWRQLLYKKFYVDRLLDESYFSYLCESTNYGLLYHDETWNTNKEWLDDWINTYHQSLNGEWPTKKYYELENDILLNMYKEKFSDTLSILSDDTDPTWHVDVNIYNTSFCSIILETDIGNQLVNLSEKTFKAISLGHPMLLLGSAGTHTLLKRLGFDLFDDIFDNMYDQELDLFDRIVKFFGSIDKIQKKSLSELNLLKYQLVERGNDNRKQYNLLYTTMHQRAKIITSQALQAIVNFDPTINING
jgi:hypothetical protein